MPVYRLPETGEQFPNPDLAEPDGLLAVGGDLSLRRLISAYALGIFPCYSAGSPILWWSPDPRCILSPEDLHIPQSLRRTLRKNARDARFQCSFDRDFSGVIKACAEKRKDDGGVWLVPEMIEAYTALHHAGLAHSVETWLDGRLAGGLYGISLGSAFFGESMFFRVPDASKVALVFLVRSLQNVGVSLIDCQQETANLLRFGAQGVPRQQFRKRLEDAFKQPTLQGRWREDAEHGIVVATDDLLSCPS